MFTRVARVARPAVARHVRFNSIKPTPRPQGSSGSSGPQGGANGHNHQGGFSGPKMSRGKILAAIGFLAVGSTIAASVYQKRPPQAAVEPEKQPEYSPDQVSVIFVLGGPGSGKGTQCDLLVKQYGFIHLSAGDLLRAEQKRPGLKYGELIANYIKNGEIVPQEITIALLNQAIGENLKQDNHKFLVDGFPRKMDQALTFEHEIVPSKLTIFFDCPELVMLKRLLKRGETLGRSDDNIESIKKRFRTFVDTLMPVVDYFEDQHKVVKVDCNQPVDVVNKQLVDALAAKGMKLTK